ncbi:hypothetical protein CR532_04540 (plasmid) [Candidatus Borreliella tachyglossi]|uniref:Uncharacterized protein n=1 Tax=Candidatus Borreliella tachyglossi TaxID=1964448 RepID=A0A2S1LY92_9SPIR|nr:hypothetical protein [Candidatus Borreliella tachyglossi]AWG43268.1 hypothetical protein CR532_04540 [Candidatus Borreliella tachyglossi]
MTITNLILKIISLYVLLLHPIYLFSLASSHNYFKVTNWRVNFERLKATNKDFREDIKELVAASEDDFLEKFKLCFMIKKSYMDSDILDEYKYLLRKSSQFLIELKSTDPKKAAYILYELNALSLLLSDIKELEIMLSHEESDEVRYYYHEYKDFLLEISLLVTEQINKFYSTIYLLDLKYLQDSFENFMIKFAEHYNSSTKLYSRLYKLYNQYFMTKR